MADAKDAAQAEAYSVLAAGVSGAPIYEDVPANTPPPIVVLGDCASEPIGGKDDHDEQVSIDVLTLVSAEEKAPLNALQGQIKALLRGHKAVRDGFELHFLFGNETARLDDDGVTYVGTTTFSVMAFAT